MRLLFEVFRIARVDDGEFARLEAGVLHVDAHEKQM
jgi:hypothetical protein